MQSESRVSNRMKPLFTLLFLAVAILSGGAPKDALAEETRWYDVEVIVFSQKSQQYHNSELWPVDYELPQTEVTKTLLPASNSSKPLAFSRLAQSSLQLTSEANRIKSAPDLGLLLHMGWRQPGLPEDKAVAVKIDKGPDQRLSGTLKLVLSRYLHINTDLIYREPLSGGAATAFNSTAEDASSFSLEPRYQAYHMKQSRRMRSRELHYLDHPLFGMVILVTPYEG